MVEKTKSQPDQAAASVSVASSVATVPPANRGNSESDEDEKLNEHEELEDENSDVKMTVEDIEEDSDGKMRPS